MPMIFISAPICYKAPQMSWLRFWPAVSWSLSQTGMLRRCILSQQNALLRLMRHRPAVLSCRPERPASHFLFMKSWSMIFWRCRLTGRPFWWPLAAALSAIWSGLPQPACCAALISSRFRPAFWPRLTAQSGAKQGSIPRLVKTWLARFTSRVWCWRISGFWPACLNVR